MKLSIDDIQGIEANCNDSQDQLNRPDRICHWASAQRQTQLSQHATGFDEFFMRPTRKMNLQCQISFQKNFMHEHSTSFREQLWNYMEFVSKTLNKQNQNHQFTSLSQNPVSIPLSQVFTGKHNRISHAPVKQFFKDLESHRKLEEFLSFIAGLCKGGRLAVNLIRLAIEVWEAVSKLYEKEPSQKEIIKESEIFASKHADAIYRSGKYQALNPRIPSEIQQDQKSKLMSAFKHFLQYYHTTLCLVVCQYFENPYFPKEDNKSLSERSSEGDHKRPLYEISFEDDFLLQEDSVDQFRLSPYKRIKE